MVKNNDVSPLQYLRVKEVAALTGMGVSTIWAKIKNNEFVQPVRLSAKITAFKASEIQAWLESKGGQDNG